jgi:hypothetical protein
MPAQMRGKTMRLRWFGMMGGFAESFFALPASWMERVPGMT